MLRRPRRADASSLAAVERHVRRRARIAREAARSTSELAAACARSRASARRAACACTERAARLRRRAGGSRAAKLPRARLSPR
eukprot:4403167-Prymnesium_polylepis.1